VSSAEGHAVWENHRVDFSTNSVGAGTGHTDASGQNTDSHGQGEEKGNHMDEANARFT